MSTPELPIRTSTLSRSSELAEDVVKRLNRAFGQMRSMAAASGEHDRPYQDEQATPEERNPMSLLYPFALGLAEDFSATKLVEATETALLNQSRLLFAWWPTKQREALHNWESQFNAWREWHGVDVKKFSEIKQFKAHIQARNALVHGAGRLTRYQQRTSNVTATLKEIGVNTEGGLLRIPDETIEQLRTVVLQFVLWLDEASLTAAIVP